MVVWAHFYSAQSDSGLEVPSGNALRKKSCSKPRCHTGHQCRLVKEQGTQTLLKAVHRDNCLDDGRRLQRKDMLRGNYTGWMALGRQWVSWDSVSDVWLSQQ